MTLNQGQQDAADAIFQFLLSDERVFCISGPGGVGKTYLLQHIMDDLLPAYDKASLLLGQTPVPYSVVLTATTNKAAEVLSESTGRPTSTIHSFMNLKVRNNHSTGATEISRTNQWKVHSNTVLFIDESSMVDSVLLKFIFEGLDKTCKVIFVGDHCQLAPVYEEISPIYRDRSLNFAELTEPMRNANQPALMALCQQLRKTVETGVFQDIQEVPGVIDYLDDAAALAYIDQTFATEQSASRILAYTNQRVQEYNGYIRQLRGYGDRFVKGERLINNNAMILSGTMLRVEEEVIVTWADATASEMIELPMDGQMEIYKISVTPWAHNSGKAINLRVPVDFEHYKQLLQFYASQKQWGAYFQLKNDFPDLRPKDAATAYKAQGSTYDEVLIDLENIGRCTNANQAARMLYVAASRPRNRIYLYGRLPPRFRGGV